MPNFIIICATGRSGSTTLQRILNTIPSTNICGENNNAILHLLNFYKSIKSDRIMLNDYNYFVDNNIKPCWYNNFNRSEIINDIKKLIIKFLDKDEKFNTIGFKEIRFSSHTYLLDEFVELFPNTKIIINIRNNIDMQSKSSWWIDNSNSKNILTDWNNEFILYYENNKNNTYMAIFEDLFDLEKIKNLFIFLEKDLYFDCIKIKEILDNNQG